MLVHLNISQRGERTATWRAGAAGHTDTADQFSIAEQRNSARRASKPANGGKRWSGRHNRIAVHTGKTVGDVTRMRVLESVHVGERHVGKVHSDERAGATVF